MYAVSWEKSTITITNKEGLHARPATEFVQKANQFDATIKIGTDAKTVNAKSIMHVLTLGAGQGFTLYLRAQGPDAAQAVRELTDLLNATVNNPKYEEKLRALQKPAGRAAPEAEKADGARAAGPKSRKDGS